MTEPDQIIIVTGWRGANTEQHRRTVEDAMYGAWREANDVLLRHGKCPYGGVDEMADQLARSWGWTVEEFPAEISPEGRILGPARNRRMCAAVPKAHLLLAFPGPGSRGTWDCLRWATRFGIPSQIVPLT